MVKLAIKNPLSIESGFFEFGAPGRIRTSDPLIRSQVLYPAELRALIQIDVTLCSWRRERDSNPR